MNTKHFRIVLSGLAVGLMAGGTFGADKAATKKEAVPTKATEPVRVALPKTWTPFGELQVAASKRLMPQISELGAQAKFTLLPMLVQQALSGGEAAMNFGAPDDETDLGVKFFIKGEDVKSVWMWPLAKGGADAWKKSNPGKTVKGSAFSTDGKWAFFADDEALVKLAVAKVAPIAKPLKKGMLRITLDGREFLDNIKTLVGNGMQEYAKAIGQNVDEKNDESLLALDRLARNLNSLRVTLGVAKSGVDIRIKAVPREGGSLDCPPKGLEEWELMFAKTNGWDMISFIDVKPDKKDAARKELEAELAKFIPESASAQEPVFAMRQKVDISEKPGEAVLRLWVFCWRDSGTYKLIVRLPSDSVALIFASMVKIGTEGMPMEMPMPPQEPPQQQQQPKPATKGGAK